VFAAIFKPRPYPAFVLLANSRTHKGKKEEWWDLHYTFADQSGAQHENTIEIWNDEEAARWKVGDSGKVRYHPDFPEEHRWLE